MSIECRGCALRLRAGNCADPVYAGIAEEPCIAFAPDGHAATCPARVDDSQVASDATAAPLPPMGDKEFARLEFRVGLFRRRGLPPSEAETLACQLAQRDHERDDRRVCLECESTQRNGRCFKAANGQMPGFSPFFEPLRTTLQRCPSFTFQRP